jgi:MscS family membrane protein
LTYLCEMCRALFRPQRRGACLGAGACLLFLSLLLCVPAWAQLGIPSSSPTAAQPQFPKDLLDRTTPRGTVFGFLAAARKGDDELASQYLDTRLRGKAAADLAHQLFVVLDRRLPPTLHQLSDNPEGSLSDPLRPNQEPVGTISSDDHNEVILLERVDRGKSGPLWLFSSVTLESIPDLYEEINVVPVDNVLPEFLVNTRFADIPLFEWLAVFGGIPLLYFLMSLLSRLLSPPIGLLRRRLYQEPDLPNPESLPKPVRLLLLAFVIHWTISKVSLPLLGRQFWSTTTAVIAIAACTWMMLLLNGKAESYIRGHLRNQNHAGATSLLRLTRRLIDLLIIFAGLLILLHYFGMNPTAALAGLGVGGIAVALAAQKTLENVIGGISLIFDRVVRVGDVLKVGDTLGTVDDVGLRSTRIRTLDRTMVSVPNGQIANMTLENFSSRDKFWFHPILALRYGTTSPQMYAVLDGVRRLLEEGRQVEPDSVRVRFLRFSPSSLDVEVFAYVSARDWSQFLEIQEGFLLRIMECIESAGVQIAPSQTIFMAAAPASAEAAVEKLLKATAPDDKASDQATAKPA